MVIPSEKKTRLCWLPLAAFSLRGRGQKLRQQRAEAPLPVPMKGQEQV